MPTQGASTPLQPILDAIVARLYAVLELEENQQHLVMFARVEESPRFQGDQDIVLRISGVRPLPGFMEGHGVIAPGVRRGLIVQVRTRASRDPSDRVDNWLATQLPREDLILYALTGFVPQNEALDNLCINEMRLEDTEAYKNELSRIPPADATWGANTLVFAIDYVPVTPPLLIPE